MPRTMKAVVLIFIVLCCCWAYAIVSEEEKLEIKKKCVAATNCLNCMIAHKLCAWCAEWENEERMVKEGRQRCDVLADLKQAGCINSALKFVNATIKVLKDAELRDEEDSKSSQIGQAVQIRPQHVEMFLRPGEPSEFDFTFQRAKNYPIYVYFLMDLSKTMVDDRDKLISLGSQIVDNLSKISKKFRVAFGTFIDKPVAPFLGFNMPDNECGIDSCVKPYDFRHQLKFTNDNALFTKTVREAKFSYNLDKPEGQFDALMQVMVCDSHVGWMPNARKMIVLMTDSTFHFAGDGLLAGIVKPHDGACHLNTSGTYVADDSLDYPSVGHIAVVARERKINIIFAVSDSVRNDYEQLPDLIPGSFVDTLSNDSSNIMQLLQYSYQNVSELIEMAEEYKPAGVQVEILSICNWTGSQSSSANFVDAAKCNGVKQGQQIRYRVRVTVKDCTAFRRNGTTNLILSPIGLADRIVLTLQTNCACDCEKPAYHKTNSSMCFNRGSLVCGLCEQCQPPYKGSRCNCDERRDNNDRCRASNASALCSGHGTCECGECLCNPLSHKKDFTYTGTYCECDNFACPYSIGYGQICSGPDHGRCVCGKCECKTPYSGVDCSCDQSKCVTNGSICNGRGHCDCNQCNCTAPWTGVHCDICLKCDQDCPANSECALCVGFQRGRLLQPAQNGLQAQCDPQCDNVIRVDELDTTIKQPCSYKLDDEGCIYQFTVERNESSYIVRVSSKTHCVPAVNFVPIIVGISGGVLLIGLGLISAWKIWITFNDRREYAEFLKLETGYMQTTFNPIYIPTVTVANPTYTGR